YEPVCAEVERTLRGLTTRDGRALVRDVLRTAGGVEEAMDSCLPDLIVHWDDAAFDAPLKIKGARLEAVPAGLKFTGQHAPDGFCVARGVEGLGGATVRAEELHRLIVETLRAGPRREAAGKEF
ncbi:MAG: hypothetical protein M3416_18405, partial [Acidobacteriota bacterium]|nr:hypothetical protein [Acidobacteriota bacterium]